MQENMKKNKKIEELESQLESLKKQISSVKEEDKKNNEEIKVLYKWNAPSRVFKRWDNQKLYTVYLWLLVVIVLLLFIKQYFTIVVILALGFVIYAMTRYPPQEVEHTITDKYIVWFDKEYPYSDLNNYWFSKREDQLILNVDTQKKIPARLIYLVNEKQKEEIAKILGEYIPYKDMKTKQSRFSKMIDGVYIGI